MRLVLVTEQFPKRSQPFIAAQVVGLLDAGLDVHVVCRRRSDDWAALDVLRDRPDVAERVHETTTRGDPVETVRAVGRLAGAARRRPWPLLRHVTGNLRLGRPGLRWLLHDSWLVGLDADVVHFEFLTQAAQRTGLRVVIGRPFSASVRGFDVNFFALDDHDRLADVWAGLDALHCLGADLWARSQARGCPATMPHALIPPAVDAALFAPPPGPRPRPPGPFRVLSVGRLHWKKGYPDGLAAVRRLVDDGVDVRYTILGDGPARDEVEAAVDGLALTGCVELPGFRPADAVRDHLAHTDVLLHPAVSEGFANAVLEAQAMAVPVVCTDADGLAENVADGETGFVVPRRDPDGIAQRLRELADDPDRRSRMGRAGRQRVLDHFTPASQTAAFVRFFAEVARAG